MLKGKKLLITGPAGNVGYPLARSLAKANDVWGMSRFGNPVERQKVEDIGVTTVAVDLENPDFSALPQDFDYVIHLSALIVAAGLDYGRAIKANAVGTGLLMTHCRNVKAFLSMSSTVVYKPDADPWHGFLETDPIGDANLPGSPTYSMSKISQEAVARFCAAQMGIPAIICRLNAAYGETGGGGLPGRLFDTIRDGQQLVLRGDPNPYSPIHDRDIYDQLEAMLNAASVDCPIVNWGGDDAVSAQEMARYFGELLEVTPDVVSNHFAGSQSGVALDTAKRMTITGPCKVGWREGMKELAEAHLQRTPVTVA